MKKEIIVIKIGGSVIFDKDNVLNKSLIKQLFKIFSLSGASKMVVIGCGEKLHKLTYKYNLTDKPEIKDGSIAKFSERIEGFFKLYKVVDKNLLEIANLIPNSTRPKPVHPACLFIKTSKGSIKSHEITWFNQGLFDRTKYPMTSGGIVLDGNILVSAISSDTIASYLAKTYGVNKMILLSDVDGVYNNINGGELLREVSLKKIRNYKIIGGMSSKLRRIKSAVDEGIPTAIINGNFPERIWEVLLKGKTEIYSEILP